MNSVRIICIFIHLFIYVFIYLFIHVACLIISLGNQTEISENATDKKYSLPKTKTNKTDRKYTTLVQTQTKASTKGTRSLFVCISLRLCIYHFYHKDTLG